jgi:hypothetical protein
MTEQQNEPTLDDVLSPIEDVHPDHREHGKMPPRPDVDELQDRAKFEQWEVETDPPVEDD